MWQLRETRVDAARQVVLRLGIGDDATTRAIWDHAFDLELIVTVGNTLQLELVTRNTGSAPFCISEGFHTYFRVGDIARTTIAGLDNCEYLDKVSNVAGLKQRGAVCFGGETDRVYLDTTATCSIDDPVLRRSIRVAKGNSASTVVWNPWSEKEKTFADMATGEYTEMLCLESVNAGPVDITVAPGGRHSLVASISVA
jgi:glucose-6-phosphate 1-epimerase